MKSLSPSVGVVFLAVGIAVTQRAPAQPQPPYLTVGSSSQHPFLTPTLLVDQIIDNTVGINRDGSATTNINGGGNPPSNLKAMGYFYNGLTPAGTQLPPVNQPPTGPAVTYAGGIGVANGVILCTGLASDTEPGEDPDLNDGLGVGAQGPNNGFPLGGQGLLGETDFELGTPGDSHYASVVSSGFDATVLNFDIVLEKPGILRFSYVHGTDEFPRFTLQDFNDSLLVFVKNPRCPNPKYENFIVFRELVCPDGGDECEEEEKVVEEKPLSLDDLRDCGKLIQNFVAPAPPTLANGTVANNDKWTTEDRYDHEYNQFSVPLKFDRANARLNAF